MITSLSTFKYCIFLDIHLAIYFFQDPFQRKRILDELESEIYEINAEQQFLFLRLKRIIDEFNKKLKSNEIMRNSKAINTHVSQQIVPLVSDEKLEIVPTQVFFRNTEENLIKKYFELEDNNNKNYYEILDSDDEEPVLVIAENDIDDTEYTEQPKLKDVVHDVDEKFEDKNCNLNGHHNNGNSNLHTQKSLLKPISQRMLIGSPPSSAENSSPTQGYTDAIQFLQIIQEEPKVKPTLNAHSFVDSLTNTDFNK